MTEAIAFIIGIAAGAVYGRFIGYRVGVDDGKYEGQQAARREIERLRGKHGRR